MRRSADGLTDAERRHFPRPFDPAILARAKKIARTYRLVIEEDPDMGYFGCTIEMSLVMGGGRTVRVCARDVRKATVLAVATMLEHGEEPPAGMRMRQKAETRGSYRSR